MDLTILKKKQNGHAHFEKKQNGNDHFEKKNKMEMTILKKKQNESHFEKNTDWTDDLYRDSLYKMTSKSSYGVIYGAKMAIWGPTALIYDCTTVW